MAKAYTVVLTRPVTYVLQVMGEDQEAAVSQAKRDAVLEDTSLEEGKDEEEWQRQMATWVPTAVFVGHLRDEDF